MYAPGRLPVSRRPTAAPIGAPASSATLRLAAAAGLAAACALAPPAAARAASPGRAPEAPADSGRPPPTVRITVGDSAITISDLLPPGLVRLRLVGEGSEAHRVVLSRLRPRQSAAAYLHGAERWLRGGSFELWGEDPGTPGMVAPGDSTDVVVRLHPGHYVIASWTDGQAGPVRIRDGVRSTFQVPESPAGIPQAAPPEPDVTVRMTDYAYELSGPLGAGRNVIRVVNRGPQEHDFQMARLRDGRPVAEARAWLEGASVASPPLRFVGGLVGMSPGHEGFLEVTLTPGRYVLLCLVPDVGDRKPHLDHGMLTAVRVRPREEAAAGGSR